MSSRSRALIEALVNPDASVPFKKRLGRCYELAGRLATSNSEAVLVHGSIQGFGKPRIDHAWVEVDGQVWEPAGGQLWDRRVFDAIFNPVEEQRYDHNAVLSLSLEHGTWGPWSA